MCAECDIQIEIVVFYIRNVLPFLFSAYDQSLKRFGGNKPFENVAHTIEWTHYKSCLILKQVFTRNELLPLHYDSSKSNLVSSFFSHLCTPNDTLNKAIYESKIKVNRSLSVVERECLIRLNAVFGACYSQKLSDLFLSKMPDLMVQKPNITNVNISAINASFEEQINWVNANFFNSNNCISFNETDKSSDYDEKSCNIANETHILMEDLLIDELRKTKS